MPAVARSGDKFSTGHGCTTESTLTGPSADVLVNNLGVERRGDPSVSHTVTSGKKCVPHVVKISGGSSTVFVNNVPVARVNDSIDSGKISSGSPDVFAG